MAKRRATLLAAALLLAVPCSAALASALVSPVATAVFGVDGRLWRVVPRKDGIEVDYSTDRAASFSPPVRVNAKRQRVRATPEDRPAIAVDGDGRVFVTWAADDRQPWTRFFASSLDGGRTFSAPVAVSDAAGRALQYQTVVQAGAQGAARVFWVDARNQRADGPPIGSLFFASFGPDTRDTPRSVGIHDSMCECCRLDVARAADGASVVLGRLVFDGRVRDMGLVTVAADGSALARRVSDDDWAIDACPEHGPALSVGPGGRYHLTWFTMGSKRQGLYYAHTDDAGRSLSTLVPVGDPARLAGHGAVGASGDRVAVAWQEFDGKRLSIHAMLSRDRGDTWETPREIAGSEAEADYPFVLSDGRGLYLSWYAADSGYHLYPLAAADAP